MRLSRCGPPEISYPDAYLVALMRQHGVKEIWTGDRDFRKFDGIVARDPFTVKADSAAGANV